MTRGLIVITSLALSVVASGQPGCSVRLQADRPSTADRQTIERAFAEGGIVTLHLSSGDYTVRAGASDRVRVEWRADDPANAKDALMIRVAADVFEGVATIRTKGPTGRARFTIEVPARSDVHLRVRAGDIRIEGIEGNKDVRMTAGDLYIDVQPESLRHVHASVSIGDLKARSLGIEKDGFKNSLDWFGDGQYTLDARLFAGDVHLR
jgi:hypothetical protein